ncbi:MAG: hypothetical protein AB1714_27665 [Acidobacteriota bacterium]
MSSSIQGPSNRPVTITQPQTASAESAKIQDVAGTTQVSADEKTASTATRQTSVELPKDTFEIVLPDPSQSIFGEGRTQGPSTPTGPQMTIRELAGETGAMPQGIWNERQVDAQPLPAWAGVGAAEGTPSSEALPTASQNSLSTGIQQGASQPLPTWAGVRAAEGSEALPTQSAIPLATGVGSAEPSPAHGDTDRTKGPASAEALPTASVVGLPTGIQPTTEP